MKDLRDNRGKRHQLPVKINSIILAILSGRTKMSSIHRFIVNKIDWLKEILNRPEAYAVSRAQLPIILAVVKWEELNKPIEEFFGINFKLKMESGRQLMAKPSVEPSQIKKIKLT